MTPTLALTALLLVVGAASLVVVSERRAWRPTLATALLVAVVLRLAMFAVAHDVAPYDLANDFRIAGENVLAHQDPTLNSRPRGWNYLPTYAFLLAGMVAVEEATGLPWLVVARVLPVAFDLGVTALVFLLAGKETGGLRAFQYACTPIAILVSAVHGQMEPLCLLLAVGAFVAVRPGRTPRVLLAGVLIGLAISVKTWPVILVPALLLALPTWRGRVRLLLAAAAVGLALLLTMPLTVGTPADQLPRVVAAMAGYSPAGGTWGWSSLVFLMAPYDAVSFETSTLWAVVGRIGSVAALLAVAAALWWWRRADPVVVAAASTSAFLVATAGFGAQYLAWPAPFTTARPTPLLPLLQVAVGVWAWVGYVALGGGLVPAAWSSWSGTAWQVSSLVLVALIVAALPWRQRGHDRGARPAAAVGQR